MREQDRYPSILNVDKSTQGHWIEIPNEMPGWTVTAHIVKHGGDEVIAELRIYPNRRQIVKKGQLPDFATWGSADPIPEHGITATLIHRQLNPGRIIPILRRRGEMDYARRKRTAETPMDLFRLPIRGAPPPPGSKRPRGRPRLDDTEFLRIADLHDWLVNEEGERKPIEVMAGLLGEEPQYIRDRMYEARKRGLHTSPARRGQAGGHLTEKAIQLFNQLKQEESDGFD